MKGIGADEAENVELYIVDASRGQAALIFIKYLPCKKGFENISKLLKIPSRGVTMKNKFKKIDFKGKTKIDRSVYIVEHLLHLCDVLGSRGIKVNDLRHNSCPWELTYVTMLTYFVLASLLPCGCIPVISRLLESHPLVQICSLPTAPTSPSWAPETV